LPVLAGQLEHLETERNLLSQLSKEQINLRERLDVLRGKGVKVSGMIETQKRMVSRVTLLGECPTCFQPVPERHKERIKRETREAIIKLEAEFSTVEEGQHQLQEQLEELKKKIEVAEEADRKYVETSTRVKMLESRTEELDELEVKIEEVKASISTIRQKMMEITETSKTLEEINQSNEEIRPKANLAKEMEKLSAAKVDLKIMFLQEEKNNRELMMQLTNLQMSAKQLDEKYDVEEHEKVDNEVKALRESRAKIMEGMVRVKKSMEENTFQVVNVKEVLAEKRKSREKGESLKVENRVIDVLRQSLRDVVQPVMRNKSVIRVSEAFQSFYQELSHDSIDYAALDKEGNIDITRNGEPSPVNSLSGGETTCAALALRLAICSSLTRNQLLLLDEPTIHLDELYRAKLRDFLSNHSFEQLVVVTHDNTFDSLPAKIFRVEKSQGRSVVSALQLGSV
jgi:exonuclease SbcC